jgi:alpha,alpha-trehalose phosphorylase
MDLADVGGNVRDGVHAASIGGTWMALVYGLAGMRDYYGELSFNPRPYVDRLKFPLTLRGQRLVVDIVKGSVTYVLEKGAGLTIRHCDEVLNLEQGVPIERTLCATG